MTRIQIDIKNLSCNTEIMKEKIDNLVDSNVNSLSLTFINTLAYWQATKLPFSIEQGSVYHVISDKEWHWENTRLFVCFLEWY